MSRERLGVWLMATRPFSFTASIIPVLVGTLLAAEDHFNAWRFILVVIGSVAIHAGTNLVNDYYDHVKGVDDARTLGPSQVIQRGLMSPRAVMVEAGLFFAVGIACGLALTAIAGWEVLLIGVLSVAAGFFYTAAPVSLAYIGLGELTVFLFMGTAMVVGAHFVQTEAWAWEAFVVSIPIGFLVTAILHANNIRDIDTDAERGKHTLATIIGRKNATVEYVVLIAGAFVALVVAAVLGAMPWPGLVALVTLPMGYVAVKMALAGGGLKRMNIMLFQTVKLHMRFGALMAAGILVGVLI
jgi:1,4-dihydroxy-2-naphthoate octaprenyltransferase